MKRFLIALTIAALLGGGAWAISVPTGWPSWTDEQRIAYADSIISYGRSLVHIGEKIKASVEKGQETLENLDALGIELTAQQVLQVRNKFVQQHAAEFIALPDSVPVPGS